MKTKDLGFAVANTIFKNDNPTETNKELFKATLKVKKDYDMITSGIKMGRSAEGPRQFSYPHKKWRSRQVEEISTNNVMPPYSVLNS